MQNKTIFRETQELYELLQQDLRKIKSENKKSVLASEQSLMAIDQSVRALKRLVKQTGFECMADEIYFFRECKPSFIALFMYHSEILRMTAHRPALGEAVLKEYYEAEMLRLTEYYAANMDFHSYYRRGATYLDHRYFVRNSYDLKMTLPLGLYNYDETFTTSHDQMVARILANEQLEEYLKTEIRNIGKENPETASSSSPLVWSFSKAALVELVYAMHLTHCCNGGSIELSEMIRVFEKTLTVNLGNFHKILNEISLRKTGRTKFLHLLAENLEQHFTDSDGK